MKISEFRKKIKSGITLNIESKDYKVKQVVKFRFDDGSFYIKCFLNDGYVLADDLGEEMFILVKEVKTPFQKPFPKKLEYRSKRFKFIYNAHAIAEEVWGQEIFKKGESERFWDYESEDGDYLSLGIVDKTNQKLDFYGKIISGNDLKL
ncbi:DUF4178 domain-containing protein [Patescibacteria group bacterium]